MQPIHRAFSLTQFRVNPGLHLDWVEKQGGHVWLTRHGKHVAALVPFHELRVLEAVLGLSETAEVERIEKAYSRFRAAKAAQAHEERARLAAGKQVGGAALTARKARMTAEGLDPWTDDPVLIAPGRRKGLRFATPEEDAG